MNPDVRGAVMFGLALLSPVWAYLILVILSAFGVM
jgi:hypothetical protein